MTAVGHYTRPKWTQTSDDLCSAACKVRRMDEKENLRKCRVSGMIFLVIGGILVISSFIFCHIRRSCNEGQALDAMEHSSTVITSTTETTTSTTGISPGSKPMLSNPRQHSGHVQYTCCGWPSVVAQVYPMETDTTYSAANSRQPQPWSRHQPSEPPPAYDSAVHSSPSTGTQCATEWRLIIWCITKFDYFVTCSFERQESTNSRQPQPWSRHQLSERSGPPPA